MTSPVPTRPDDRAGSADRLRVTVVICAYTLNRWSETKSAVASVVGQRPAPAQVLLVIDHNPELAALARAELPEVTVLESSGDPGLSGARNTGLAAATEPVTAFLDDDAEAQPGWLATLIEPYEDAGVAATGGGVWPRWAASRPDWLPPEFDWVVGCSYVGLPVGPAAVRNPIGANMSFRTQLALEAGGFNGSVGRIGTRPRGCEETELAIRVTATAEAAVMYVPAAAVDHHVGPERTRFGYFVRRCWHEGQSKAAVVGLVGASAGLSRERRQAAVIIPAAIRRDLGSLCRGRVAGGKRIVASVVGLAASATGYSAGRVTRNARPSIRR
ncbi:MAG: glycosyltransferase family 2 protein [Streptosporangiaceae bacterium]